MDHQQEFLRQTALFNAIGAAFQRASIYADGAAIDAKNAFRSDLENHLCQFELQYKRIVTAQEHIRNIDLLAKEISRKHTQLLRAGWFRVGVAQKALNIYLKLIWCYGWIPEPPHCPIDSIVLAEIGDTETKWTKMGGIDAYQTAIEAIATYVRQHAPGKSLAQWELEVWSSRTAKRVQSGSRGIFSPSPHTT